MKAVRAIPSRATSALRSATLRRLALAAVAAMAVGCASPPAMRGEVTRFHAWRAEAPLTFAFAPTAAQAASLEHRSYEQLARARLLALGFTEAARDGARYRVEMTWQVTTEPRRVTEYWPSPYGFGPAWTPWQGPRPYGGGLWRADPWWGLGPVPISYDVTLFRHELRVDLFDRQPREAVARKVYESRATTLARTESMPRLMPALVQAVFDDFPGESGSTRSVEIPLSQAGRP
jgi:hypothetical protein